MKQVVCDLCEQVMDPFATRYEVRKIENRYLDRFQKGKKVDICYKCLKKIINEVEGKK